MPYVCYVIFVPIPALRIGIPSVDYCSAKIYLAYIFYFNLQPRTRCHKVARIDHISFKECLHHHTIFVPIDYMGIQINTESTDKVGNIILC